jgi:hypothetical protein
VKVCFAWWLFSGWLFGQAVGLPTEREALHQVPQEHLEAYFSRRPTTFIVDPQSLLSGKDERERESFLQYHAGDAKVDLYIYLFEDSQAVPVEMNGGEMAAHFFSEGKPAVLIYYFLGAPQKAQLYVSPSLAVAVSTADQRRVLMSAVESALEKPEAAAQLQAFCVQLTIDIYWMESAAGLVAERVTPGFSQRVKASESARKVSPLEQAAKDLAERHGMLAGIVGGAILLLAIGWRIVRRRVRYRFPVIEVAPRLGGAHAAGIGAVISFGNTTQSPYAQRNDAGDLGL